MLKATPQIDRIFTTCSERTFSAKVTELVRLAAHLATPHPSPSTAGATLKKAIAGGATRDEVLCVACLSACAGGPAAVAAFTEVQRSSSAKEVRGKTSANPFARVKAEALDKKTTHLVSLAACLAAHCECAAGHIVEARRAGAKEKELARAACLAACASGLSAKWRFAAALQCAAGHQQCAC